VLRVKGWPSRLVKMSSVVLSFAKNGQRIVVSAMSVDSEEIRRLAGIFRSAQMY